MTCPYNHTLAKLMRENKYFKQFFSFSKAQRFRPLNKDEEYIPRKGNSRVHCYDLPSATVERWTSFGFGGKIAFPSTGKQTPAPSAYKIPSEFDVVRNPKRGFTFGLSREDYAKGPFKRKAPGPGDYSELKVMGVCGKKFSFRSRPSTACIFRLSLSLAVQRKVSRSRELSEQHRKRSGLCSALLQVQKHKCPSLQPVPLKTLLQLNGEGKEAARAGTLRGACGIFERRVLRGEAQSQSGGKLWQGTTASGGGHGNQPQ